MTDPEKRLAYCHVPKAASSSWMSVFADLNGIEERKDLVEEFLTGEDLETGYLSLRSYLSSLVLSLFLVFG